MQLSGVGRFRSISQISIRNICVTDGLTLTLRLTGHHSPQCLLCHSAVFVVIKFLNEVSHVSPYFKVHWTKCTVLKRSEGIPLVILARLVGQKAICQNILNWCKAITSSPPQSASPADRNGNILINSPQVETLYFVSA